MARFALDRIRRKGAAVAAVVGIGALAAACAQGPAQSGFARPASYGETATSVAPMSLACEPNQRAVMRQVVVNGVAQSQMACESVAPGSAVGTTGTFGAVPAAYSPSATPVSYTQAAIPDTRFVRTASQPEVVTRQAAPQRIVYQRSPERIARPKRSVGTSALIIGSSAAGGAGLGALIGGKKGAGIGAIASGGAAALWDQITRHRQ